MAGRNRKLNDEVSKIICDGVRLRMSYKCATARAGVSEEVFYHWLRVGRKLQAQCDKGKTPRMTAYEKACLNFLRDVTRAIADGQHRLLTLVHSGAEDDWRAGAWILERRHPEDFALRRYQPISSESNEGVNVIFDRPDLDSDFVSDDLTAESSETQ